MTWRALIAVAVGGALGTLARVGVDLALGPSEELTTAVVNLGGALALGLALGHGLPSLPLWFRDGITIGFLGSFTTMSGIALLALLGGWAWGALYVVGTFVLGVLAAWAGYHIGQARQGVRQ